MKKFPHIEQFRTVIKRVRIDHDYVSTDSDGNAIFDHKTPYPTMKFVGTVKLDGTNAAVGKDSNSELYFQSRSRMLGNGTDGDDNAGFAAEMNQKMLDKKTNSILFGVHGSQLYFGEWCGAGIQNRCGISKASKRFIIFDRMFGDIDGEFVRDIAPNGLSIFFSKSEVAYLNKQNIWFIDQFKTFTVDIDFNHPELAADQMTAMVDSVESECPVAKSFGFDASLGEGIVWKSFDNSDDSKYWFKTKGTKHEGAKSVKRNKVEIDPIKLESIEKFVEFSCTESRMKQALDFVKEQNGNVAAMKDVGMFLKWLNSDIARECKDDLEASVLTMKDVGSGISKKSVSWFKENF